ncbi:MAG: beta-phosphoglucomutase family hydrolase [Lutibacter sp.]|nr:beta-phosphoglucomutase family hydrolase [Lutibacter sp.]MBP9601231.1 beta-phosphoglucomutase family hydrolase [Lutibacter sp.]
MIEIPKNAKALIFDLDGTIANTMQYHFEAWRKAVEPYGIDFSAALFLSLTGSSRVATIDKLNELFGTKMIVAEVGRVKAAHFKTLVQQTTEIKVVADVVRKYHTILPISIGTGSTTNGATTTLKIINMQQYFDIIITSDNIENSKPHPETFLKCAQLMGVNPKDCVVFEDGVLGMQAAKTAGMMVIDVNDYYKFEFIV